MKKLMLSLFASVLFLTAATAQYSSDTRTGYDGDFFSLEGAIELFKKSRSLEEFERRLNSQNSYVNNLDLDYDGQIDYVRVEHQQKGDFHAIILQVPVSRNVAQDVAVIEIERTSNDEALLQIVGDEYLYGDQIIAEPYDVHFGSDRSGPNVYENYTSRFINVYYWPIVNSFFGRRYRPYVSPYYWSYYPTYWQPWRPFAWSIFRPRIAVYGNYCRVVNIHRVYRVHNFYSPNRRYASTVFRRTNQVRVNNGRQPYSRANEPRYNSKHYKQSTNSRVATSKGTSRNSTISTRGTANTKTSSSNTYKGSNSRSQASDRGRTSSVGKSTNTRVNSSRGTRGSVSRSTPSSRSTRGTVSRGTTSTQRGKTSGSRSSVSKQGRTSSKSSSRSTRSTSRKRS